MGNIQSIHETGLTECKKCLVKLKSRKKEVDMLKRKRNICCLLISVVCIWIVLFMGCEKTPPASDTPIAKFVGEPIEGIEPLVVKFTDLSEAKDSEIVSWYWDFGDGTTSSQPNPIKTYYHRSADGNNPSYYTVKLRITTGKGTAERTEKNYIRVNPGTTFTVLDPMSSSYSGVVSGYGVILNIPKGALRQKVTFSINQLSEVPAIRFSEDVEVVSNYYRIAHDLPVEDMFAKDGDKIVPVTMQIPLLPGESERTDRPSNRYMVMALLVDGSVMPILGERRDNYAVSSMTGLPSEAIYFVGFFPKALITEVKIEPPEDVEIKYPWALKWRVFGSEKAFRQVIALEKGDLNLPNSFYKEDFTDDEVVNSSREIIEKLLRVYSEFLMSGMKNPILVGIGEGTYGLVLFNINSTYTSDYKDFDLLRYGSSSFGNIVIDPKQLLMISIHNAISASLGNDDIKQKFTIYNAFAQYLFYSCYRNYRLVDLTVPDISDLDPRGNPKLVSFMRGLRESIAIYMGQRADKVSEDSNGGSESVIRARAFGDNEYYDLTQALFQPVAQGKKGYYKAGHEFWVFLDDYLEKNYSDIPVPAVIGAFLQGLEDVFDSLNPRQVMTYELLMNIVYKTLDEVLKSATSESEEGEGAVGEGEGEGVVIEGEVEGDQEGEGNNGKSGEGLSDVYWKFARARGFERGESSSVLRPSDMDIEKFEPNEKAISIVPVVEKQVPAPTDTVTISASNVPELSNVLPCSSRVVKVQLNPMSSVFKVQFYPEEWVKDDNSNSLRFAVYYPGAEKYYLLDVDGRDTNLDGVNDEITIGDVVRSDEGCFDYIYLLVSNVSLSSISPIRCTFNAEAGMPYPEREILRKYVEECDPFYNYELVSTGVFTQVGISSYVLKMTSGIWRGESEVVNAVPWTHYLTIIEPPLVLSDKALLVVTGGSTTSEPDLVKLVNLAYPFVAATGTVACFLRAVPNQPLRFVDDTEDRVEDGIIAYSFDKYMRGFEMDSPDMTWPALLPMVRSAVLAMDTVQDFMKYKKPGNKVEIKNFIVTGASKRGWTSWLTSAVDSRVCAVMPIVIDVLNMPLQIEHHYNCYGTFSSALEDYVNFGIFDRLETPEGNSLWKIVDPIHYVDTLQMPKFIVNSTGDQFFLPDSAKYYFNLLKPSQVLPSGDVYPTNAYLYYAPNTDHSISSSYALDLDEATFKAMLAFYISEVKNIKKPEFRWWVEEDTMEPDISKRAIRIRLDAITKPKEVLLWQATNKTKRDFRLQTIGLSWTGKKLKPFCTECGGDPGFDYESIFEDSAGSGTPQKSFGVSNDVASQKYDAMRGEIEGTDNIEWMYLEGSYYQMGYNYGYLQREAILSLVSLISSYPEIEKVDVDEILSNTADEWKDIIRGVSDAVGLNFDEVVKAQYIVAMNISPQRWSDGNYLYAGYYEVRLLPSNYVVVVWKPVGGEEFITVEPLGLVSMGFVVKDGNVLAYSGVPEKLFEQISYVFRWLNSSLEMKRASSVGDCDFILWDGNGYSAVEVQLGVALVSDYESSKMDEVRVLYRFDGGDGKLIFSDGGVELEGLLAALSKGQIDVMNAGGQYTVTEAIEESSLSTFEKSGAKQLEGGDEEECVCEFSENDVYPYVGTVPVPGKGWTAFFIQIKFPGPERYVPELRDVDYVFSTRVVVVPDVYPSERQ